MSPNTLERAVLVGQLDDRLRAILKFKLREFVHLNPCFNAVTPLNEANFSIDLRNQSRLLNLESAASVARQVEESCPHQDRYVGLRRKIERRVAI